MAKLEALESILPLENPGGINIVDFTLYIRKILLLSGRNRLSIVIGVARVLYQ